MQQPFSCVPSTYTQIEGTLSPARLKRYLPAANGDIHYALRLYVWNARLCEALYLPMQLAEVSARNAIAIPVQRRFGVKWYQNAKFLNLLPNRHKETIEGTVKKELKRRHVHLNQDHIIAGLPFGFWVALMTRAYDKQLWANGIVNSFPNANKAESRETIHRKLDQLRHFRNNVAHHFAVFDQKPTSEYQNALDIIGFVCIETQWFTAQISRVGQTINDRPHE